MDDFNVSSLHESKNEWGARLLTIFCAKGAQASIQFEQVQVADRLHHY